MAIQFRSEILLPKSFMALSERVRTHSLTRSLEAKKSLLWGGVAPLYCKAALWILKFEDEILPGIQKGLGELKTETISSTSMVRRIASYIAIIFFMHSFIMTTVYIRHDKIEDDRLHLVEKKLKHLKVKNLDL
jgi:hypothetical protein